MVKFIGFVVLGLIWCNVSYSNVIMQDLIDVLVEIKKPKSLEVAKTLHMVSNNNKSYDLVIRKANLTLKDAKKLRMQSIKLVRITDQNFTHLV